MTVASVTAARRRLHRQHEKSPSTAAPTRRTAICPPRRRLRLPHLSSRTATTTCSLFAACGSPCV